MRMPSQRNRLLYCSVAVPRGPYCMTNAHGKSASLPLWLPLVLPARAVVLGWSGGHRVPGGRCQICGYDLTGNTTGRCPECGIVCGPDGLLQ